MELKPALFLDRDGVIVEEVAYLADPSGLALIPGTGEAIARVNRLGIPVVVATNQAGVARGYFPETRVDEVHEHLNEVLAKRGAHIDRYYYCPHHPTEGISAYRLPCECRKPRPGMLLRAARDLGLDLARSFLVGDKVSDLQAGAVCRQAILVRTGYGEASSRSLHQHSLETVLVMADLQEAVEFCLPFFSGSRQAASA